MKSFIFSITLIFSINIVIAQNTAIPDPIFEQALIDQGYDSPPIDGYVPTANISSLTELHVIDLGITDLTGIEDFSSLRLLTCFYNYLTSLDVSQNTCLIEFRCYHNQLTSLIHANNSNLEILDCDENHLVSIDISGASNLEYLNVANNDIESLNVSNNPKLKILVIGYNQITSLDITENNMLEHIYAEANQISSLDISGNPLLKRLWCNNNELYYLNVQNGNNVNFTEFHATNNPLLECIQVDNEVWATTNWSGNIDHGVVFSEDCTAFGINTNTLPNIKLYPNPTKGIISLDFGHLKVESIKIFSTKGELVYHNNETYNIIFTDELKVPSGIYIVELKTIQKVQYFKLVKQ